MHRDKVIGLALSILLVGIVAAFFFRPNTEEEAPPQLADPEQVNSRIAERPLTPYLTSPEFSEPEKTSEPRGTIAAEPIRPPSVAPHWELPDFLQEPKAISVASPEIPAPGEEPFSLDAAPPDPIQITEAADDPEPPIAIPIPRHNAGWEVEETPFAVAERSRSPQPQTHVVKQGDTLSELAYKYLGTSTRFLEIYEANRDQLKSPNDLRVGMTIRIPAIRQAKDSPRNKELQNARLDQPIETTPVSRESTTDLREPVVELPEPKGDSADAKPQPDVPNLGTDPFNVRPGKQPETPSFVPVRRSPFNPGRRDGLSQRDEQPAAVRSLTQVPPVGVPVLDDDAFTVGVKSPGLPEMVEQLERSHTVQELPKPDSTTKPEPRIAASPPETSNPIRTSTASQQSVRKYVVRRGDSLEGIAVRFYGTRTAARRIYEANRNRLRNPNAIPAGMTLILP